MTETNGTGAEAPASATWRTYVPVEDGVFNVQWTIRSAEAKELVKKVAAMLAWQVEHGQTPAFGYGQPSEARATEAVIPAGAAPLCPIHHKQMRESKFGGWFCGVKTGTHPTNGKDTFCDQKVAA